MKVNRKLISSLLVICMLFSMLPTSVWAEESTPEETAATEPAAAETLIEEEIPAENSAQAVSGTCGEDLTWEFDADTGTLVIQGTGEMDDYFEDPSIIPWKDYYDSITNIILEDGVTSIGTFAFYDCINLKSISIPDSVTTMPISIWTANLDKLVIPAGVTYLELAFEENTVKFIEVVPENTMYSSDSHGVLFNKDKTVLECYPGGSTASSYTVPDGVTTIQRSAFRGCRNITSVTLPATLKELEDLAFCYSTLTEIRFLGEAPVFAPNVFPYLTANVYYPENDPTWTDAVRQNYGGTITWIPGSDTEGGEAPHEHSFGSWYETAAPTCDAEGAQKRECQSCDHFETATVDALGHDYQGGACSRCNAADPNAAINTCVHNFANGKCSKCSVLGGKCGTSVYWTLDDEGLLTIYGSGAMTNFSYYSDAPWHDMAASVATVVIIEGVTSIGDYAFENCSSLTSVVIPKGIIHIGSEAFLNCIALTKVVIPEGITYISSDMFRGCSSLTEVVIPKSVTSIGGYAFDGCSSLTKMLIPERVTSIGNSAFRDCSSLTEAVIPKSVTSIGSSAFDGCSSLIDVSISENITSIGNYVFYGCSSLTEVVIPKSVTRIGNSAFYKCSSLAEVVIPLSVISIGSSAFEGCSSLTEVVIPKGVTQIGDNAFYKCSSLTEVVIPKGVTSIGASVFYGCSSLTDVAIPEGVTGIGNSAFYGCSNLREVVIPKGVTSIGNSIFNSCSSLIEVVIPEGVTSIGGSAFYGCSALTEVVIPETVTSIGSGLFSQCSSLAEVVIPKGVTSIGNSAFSNCSSLTSVVIPESVTSIGDHVFYGCSALTEVSISKGVTSIGRSAFDGCSSLREVSIPDTVLSIGEYAFYKCSKLEQIDLPDSLNRIGQYAFYGCISLTSVVIPGSVRSLGGSLFWECTNLTSITIEDGITTIGDYAFQHIYSLQSLTIPDSVTKIGNSAFLACSGLTSLVLPEYVTDIEARAFAGCKGLTSIEIPENVAKIGTQAFSDCSSLRQIKFHGDAPGIIASDAFRRINATAYYPANNDSWTAEVMQSYSGNIYWSAYTPCSHSYAADSSVAATCTKQGYIRYICSLCQHVHTEYTTPLPHNYVNEACKDCGYRREVTASGSCGSQANWALYSDGTLRIYGQGAMSGYYYGANSNKAPWYNQRGIIQSVIIEDGITAICEASFLECSVLSSVEIPDSVTAIGKGAFEECTSLTEIQLPARITSIEDSTFTNCSSLVSIHIPEGVTSIGWCAFENCTSLTDITIPSSVIDIDSWAFEDCTSLTSIELPDQVRFLFGTFARCSALKHVKLPKNLLDLGDHTFKDCTALQSLDVPDGVVRIGDQAFMGCKNLKDFSIPSSVQAIGEDAFWGCAQLTEVVIPYGVPSLWRCAFADCSSIQSLTIPVTVKSIGVSVFQKLNALTDVYYTGTQEQWSHIQWSNGIDPAIEKATIHYLGTEEYDDTVIENEIRLTSGGQADPVDRILLPDYGKEFYNWLEESTDGDGIDDHLIYDVSEYCPGAIGYRKYVKVTADTTAELIAKLDREMHALKDTAPVVYCLFGLEHSELTWLSPFEQVTQISYDTERTSDTEGYVEIEMKIYFSPIEKDAYCKAVALRDRTIAQIVSGIPKNASTVDKIRYFNTYLTKNNCYNSDAPNEPQSAHEAITALVGNTGAEGPVCEAYARAFKLLCDSQNIPCTYTIGISNGEGHAWNYVQLEDGNWYAVDTTWNDPIVPGVTDAVSGYESEAYLLVGGETYINGIPFAANHYEYTEEDPGSYPRAFLLKTGFSLPAGPTLNATSYIPKTDHTPSNSTWEITKEVTPTTEGQEQTFCTICGDVHTRKLIPVVVSAPAEPITVTAGTSADEIDFGFTAARGTDGSAVADFAMDYIITDEAGNEVTLEQALATPGRYTITPKAKTP